MNRRKVENYFLLKEFFFAASLRNRYVIIDVALLRKA